MATRRMLSTKQSESIEEAEVLFHSAMEKFMKKFKIKAPIVPVSAQSLTRMHL